MAINCWDGRANLPVLHENTRNTYPAYPYRHSGSVVVAGFAETLQRDLDAVAAVKPGLPIIAVNRACEVIKAFAIYSFHFERDKLGIWAEVQKKRFGEQVTVFGPGHKEWLEHNKRNYPYVDHWAPGSASKGSSGWCAARLGKILGFDEVILCGIPIQPGPYANRLPAIYWQSKKTNAVEQFRKAVAEDTANHAGIYSMSGWTRTILGAPEWTK
jgi:hypothetical protein